MSAPSDPAFPNPEMSRAHFDKDGCYPGMLQRQYYKAAAIPAVMSQCIEAVKFGQPAQSAEEIAARCGRIADALLAEDTEYAKKP